MGEVVGGRQWAVGSKELCLSSASDNLSTTGDFDWVLRSPNDIPAEDQWRYRSLAAMLLEDDPKRDSRSVFIGADHTGSLDVTLAGLRNAAAQASQWCQEQGFVAGDSLLLVRLPHSSEVPLATAAVALMSLGLRVVLPMSFDRGALTEMLKVTNSPAMLWCDAAVDDTSNEQVRGADTMFRSVAEEVGAATFSLDRQLNWHLAEATENSPESLDTDTDIDREVLVLSTSGSTGMPKLARYTERALLKVAEAWQAAGLMAESKTGGRSICPAVSHSMGFRNVLHAVWNRQPTMLAQTEWLEEKPKQYVKLLERCRPQHITCGPAYLGDLGLLAASVERVRKALGSLEYVVSSGAADVDIRRVLPQGVHVANAFGMTEVQQALNTLLGAEASVRSALGRPLPGVAVAVRYVDADQRIGKLFISAPFGAAGYVGAPDFQQWFETGDLVRVEDDDLVWVGRGEDDFLNTGHGVKVSLAELRTNYQHLQRESEAVIFQALSNRGGVGAIVYVGNKEPAAEKIHQHLLEQVAADHQQMASEQRDFALEYMAVSVLGCAAGRPPKRGPGKVDRQGALHEQAELLAAMDDPLADHPQVINVPPYGSDRPDWRRFAAPQP